MSLASPGMLPRVRRPSGVAPVLTILVALLASPATGVHGAQVLLAQTVAFDHDVHEGMEFRRSVSSTMQTESSRGAATEASRMTARLRVAELLDDGSGVLEVVIESASLRLEFPDGRVETWDSGDASPPVEPGIRFLAGFVGRTFEVAFLPGGVIDAALFMVQPDSDEATLDLWTLVMIVSPEDRIDGLPAGFPAALDTADPVEAPFSSDAAGSWILTFEGVSEHEGRPAARFRYAAHGPRSSEEGERSGHGLFDLETGRLVDGFRTYRRTITGQSSSHTTVIESRTQPVPDPAGPGS